MKFIPAKEVTPKAAQMTKRVSEWQVDYLDEYDPLLWKDKEKRRLRRKAFGELAFYLLFIEQLDINEGQNQTDQIKTHVTNIANDRRYFELLPRNSDMILKFGYPLAISQEIGELRTPAQIILRRVLETKSPWAEERLPHRQLDYYYLLQYLNYDTGEFDPETIIKYSNTHYQPSIIEVDLRAVYGLTHNIIYYTNFGIGGESFPNTVVPYDLSTLLTGLTLRFMAEQDTDIVAELLLCGIIQRQMSPQFVRFVFSWFHELSRGRTTVPGPGIKDLGATERQRIQNPDLHPEEMGEWNSNSKEWIQDYHTSIVSGMCFGVLKRSWGTLVENGPTKQLNHEDHSSQLMDLGKLVMLMSEYKIEKAAQLMKKLSGTPTVIAYADVFASCTDFLRRQQTHDGHIGFWTDERYLFTGENRSQEQFEREMMQPCTELCEEALLATENSRDH